METKIKWNEGEGYITATYEGSGNGSASISSDVNEGIDREQSIKVETTDKSVSATLLVSQEGLREVFEPSDGLFVLADWGTFNVLKDEEVQEDIVIEYGGYYPELVDQLIGQYGYNYGSKWNPMPFEGNIMMSGYPNESVNSKVLYIYISDVDNSFTILLYNGTYKETETCFALSNSPYNKGYCGVLAI